MPTNDFKVQVRGIRELNKAFKQVSDDLPKQMKVGFQKISQMVVDAAAPKVPEKSGKARASYKARGTAKGASIAFGGTKAPYAPWLDFGGKVGRKKSIQRAFIKEGRYLYPTIKELNPQILNAVEELVNDVEKGAGLV